MNARICFYATAITIALTGAALAQPTQPNATTLPSGMPTGNESSWQMMTETQVKDRLEREGYSDINIKEDDATPQKDWTGTARRNGRVVRIQVDQTGKVIEQ